MKRLFWTGSGDALRIASEWLKDRIEEAETKHNGVNTEPESEKEIKKEGK